MRLTIIFWFTLFLPALVFAQKTALQTRDTVIIIHLGTSNILSEKVDTEVKCVSAGMFHCSIVGKNGKVYTWADPRATSIEIPQIPDSIVNIATGDIHSTIQYKDGSINQFFVNSGLNMFYPYQLQYVTSIASGPKMSVALNKKGILYAWGPGKTIKKLQIPVKTYGVKTASVGKNHISFINIKDKVFVWGDHNMDQNKIPRFASKPIKIVSGDYHTLVLDELGKLYAWGNNSKGQCNVPIMTQPIKAIGAKNFRSIVVTKNDQVIIWGMNQKNEIDFSKIGKVKLATLGFDFAVVVVQSESKVLDELYARETSSKNLISISKAIDSSSSSSVNDSLIHSLDQISVTNFMEESTSLNFDLDFEKGNTLNIQSSKSSFADENSSTDIVFEGEGNNLTVINDGVHVKRVNSNQRVIIKGSGKKATLHYKNVNDKIVDSNSQLIIDLDQIGYENDYPQEYNDLRDPEVIVPDMIIDFDSLPSSYITEWYVENGFYQTVVGDVLGESDDYAKIMEDSEFLSDYFERAKAAFYCKQYNIGMEVLKEGAKDNFYYDCSLALFEIYYYGLFGVAPSLPLAKIHYMNYLKASSQGR
jgi:hypothetical protein